MRIRVCDDDGNTADDWVDRIKAAGTSGFDVSSLDVKREIPKLIQRKLDIETLTKPLGERTEFDDLDILVIDYDLLHLDNVGGRTTGEGVARLARLYSTCGAIVVVNQFTGRPQFDLGMRGHLDSHADVNVDAGLIEFQSLWGKAASTTEFNPTTWIPLPDLLKAARDLTKELSSADMNKRILPIIGLDETALAQLSDTAFGFFSSEAKTAEELQSVTVREFLQYSIGPKISDCLSKHPVEWLFNFAAFRVVKWLDRAVLRPMDVLVDAYHLVDRLPFLINSDKTDIDSPAAWTTAAANPQEKLRWDMLHEFHNTKASNALGRMVFDWHRIVLNEEIDRQQDTYLEGQPSRFYLAEDTSRFVKRDALTQYRADFHNFGDRRGMEKLSTITYGPFRRIHFG